MMQVSHRICVGKITVPHGLRGLVKVKPFTETRSAIADFSQLHDEGGQRVSLSIVSEQKTCVVAKIDGVSERVQAEAWSGKLLYIMRSDLPALGPEEYYCGDLVGLRAVTEEDTRVGVVRDVHDFGAGGILEIERHNETELMLSFTSETVVEVDMEGCRVVLSASAVNIAERD
jgi:16S rRNA processing protein RimM